MEVYIARQPIFTVHRKLFAYELLYRGEQATQPGVSTDKATTSLLSSAFLTEGIEKISGSKPCFINFTQELLLKRIPLSFPKSKIVVELIESIEPTNDIIEVCRLLVKQGYKLALDDFTYQRSYDPLIELAEIVKIDFQATSLDTIHKTLYKLQRFKVKLLAEKIETVEEFSKAEKLGFSYYQGFFFSKPQRIKIREIAATKVGMLQLLAEVTKKTTTLERLHKIISGDVAMSYKLLRYLNSAYFYLVQKVKTVKHAIAYLGEKELRRFVMLVIISELASDKPGELVRMALLRAKFCELLAMECGFAQDSGELFMLGLFSFIDVMLNTPMIEVMDKIPLSDEVKEALLNKSGDYAIFLDIMENYERGQDQFLTSLFQAIGVDEEIVPDLYLKAVRYADGLTNR